MEKLIKEIYDYGIGYDDSISVIAVPLIVALFAFAFPLLFQVVTHIESKYASEKISEMFRRTKTYRWFWRMTYFSIGYLFLLGTLAIALNGETRQILMSISRGVSLAVAAVYSVAIIAFVRTCIRFNNPNALLTIIGEQFRAELRYEEMRMAILKLKHLRDKVQFWRSKGWKSFRDFNFRWAKAFGHYQSTEDYGKRIEDICKYAIDTRNKNLFRAVMEEVNKVTVSEKETRFVVPTFSSTDVEEAAQPKTQQFYENLFEYVCLSECRPYFEEELVRRRMDTFNQSRLPFEKGVVSFVRDVIIAVEAGHYGIYEKYVDESDFKYLFIQNLPVTAYIMGAGVNGQKSAENKRHDVWMRMVDLHFLMNAYLFSRGHYKLLTTVQTAKYFRQGHLYPLTPNELLAVYARIDKNKLIDGGYYWHWQQKEIFGRETDDQYFLEKYVVALMMLCSEKSGMETMTVSEKVKKELDESHERLLRVAKYLKQNRNLISMYSQLAEIDFATVYDNCRKSYEEGCAINGENCNERKKGFWSSIMNRAFGWLCDDEKTNEKQTKEADIYGCDIPEGNKTLFENDLMLAFRNTGWMPRGLKENEQKGELCREELQSLYMLMNKRYVYHYNHDNTFHLYRHLEMVFEKCCDYMFYAAVSRMRMDYKTVRVADFDSFFNRYTKGKRDEYIIIDTESTLSVGIDIERDGDGYKCMFIDASEYLRDVPLVEIFRNSLLIMKKEDYPSLFRKNETAEPVVELKDESDIENGIAAIGVTITPNMEMRYYKNAKVMKVTLVR